MSRSAFTLRLPSEERLALESLSKIEGRPMNQLLNEAVRIYLKRCGAKEQGLSESLDRLRAYRERDPEYRHAIASFAKAEITEQDPLEGTIFLEDEKNEAENRVYLDHCKAVSETC